MSSANEKPAVEEATSLADDVLGEVSNQAKNSRMRSDERNAGKKSIQPLALGVVLLALTGVLFLSQADKGPPLTADESRYAMLDEMSELVYDLDDYREEFGLLPDDLLLLRRSVNPSMTFQRIDQYRYRISFREGTQTLHYESDEPSNIFFAEVRGVE